jgi:S-adenosyl-L-methionine hydrolase (adenosine-forming)
MRLIALLTDFGTTDGYVASMKAVILDMSPRAIIVDISHDISPQRIAEAGFVLWTAYRYFPAKTIFVCVVDPGVGTKRKILAVKTRDYVFLAPDNGLLDMVLAECEIKQALHLKNKQYFLKDTSYTFHGRDIFSPVASHLSKGVNLKSFGTAISLKKPKTVFQTISRKGEYKGIVIYVDRFGNLITNFKIDKIKEATLKIKDRAVPFRRTYGDVMEGELVALVGSSGLVEIAARNEDAKLLLRADYGSEVELKVK